jgi:hypothetical protein
MSGNEILMAVLKDLAVQTPSLIAILACAVFAIVRWKRHPRVSLILLIGLLLLLFHEFAFAVVYASLPDLIVKSTNELDRATTTHNVYIAVAVIYNCLEVVPFVLLLIAVFMGRRKAEPAIA